MARPPAFIPDPDLHYGRFKVLQRTDGLYVVHEKDQHGSPFRFGPVFATIVEASWRARHRAAGERELGAEIGDQVRVAGGLGFLVDFVAPVGEKDSSKIEAAVRVGSRVGLYALWMIDLLRPKRGEREPGERSGPWQPQYR